MSIQVLGLGMGRTGTSSLKTALEHLGFGPCYHMETLLSRPSDVRFWKELHRHGHTDWAQLLGPYRSAVDFPVIAYYPALLQQFPEAKCILTERAPDAWYESARATILDAEPGLLDKLKLSFRLPFSQRLRHLIQVFQLTEQFWRQRGGKQYRQREQAIALYHVWVEEIVATVPPERLLRYQVSQGWEPLCRFLAVPVPKEPFPRANSRQEFHQKNQQLLAW